MIMKLFGSSLIGVGCFFGLTTALSKQSARLFNHAYGQLDAGEIAGHGETVTHAYSLPGADAAIPINWETFPKAEVVNETAQYFPERQSMRAKVRYGPLQMDSMDAHQGMVDYLLVGAQMPCKNCTMTVVIAGLEYEDGSNANANSSAWLHHCVLINLNKKDTVCGDNYYGRGQRWFASGNERTRVSLTLDGQVPSGYYIGGDTMVLETELMNQAMYAQTVYVAITYEWIPGPQDDFYDVVPVWMDIGGCKIASDMPVKTEPDFTEETIFSYTAPTWESDFTGVFLGMGAHLHDGGVNVEIYKDLAHQMCNSVARYGETPWYIDAPGTSMVMPMSPMFLPMAHISSMSYCYAPINNPVLQNGSLLSITAHYNLTEHMPMLTLDGGLDQIMGIAVIYVAANMTQSEIISFVGNNTLPLEQVPEMTGMGGMGMMHSASDDDDDEDSDADADADADADSSDGMDGMDMGDGMDDGMGGGMMMGMAAMSCVPMRDSPGTITLTNLNTSDDSTMDALLSAIMCDSCLQVWSAPYARYFWYGIVVAIGLSGISRIATWQSHLARKHQASQVRPDIYEAPAAVAFVSTKFARVVRALSYRQVSPRVLPNMFKLPPLGIILMVLAYFGFVLGLQFTNASTGDLQTCQFLSVRAGWLSVAQLPLIVLLSTKRNFITMVTAVTYERLNVLHRWTARGLLMTALMHFGFQWHGWVQAGVLQLELTDECIPTGAAALALVLWMNVSTLAPFRKLSYEFFVLQHLITFFGTIIAVAYHIPSTAPYALTYVYVASALYLTTKLFQGIVLAFQQRRRGRASLVPMSASVTRITVSPSPFKTWKAGSFARLTIPNSGFIQSHPATIASTPSSHSGDAVFYLLKRKGFTRTISRTEKQSGTHSAILDGPYGGSQHDFAAFHSSVFISGSVGITYTLALLADLAQRSARIQLPIRTLVFVWAVRDDELVKGLQDEIAKSAESLLVAGIEVQVLIHLTGTQSASRISEKTAPESGSERSNSRDDQFEKAPGHNAVRALSDTSSDAQTRKDGSKCISLLTGRPELDTILTNTSAACEGEMGVAVCGPFDMTQQVRNKVATMQFGMPGRQAGAYLHVEGFGW